MPAEDVTISSTFSVNSYTITYIVDGETYATDSIAYGSEIVLREELTKEGHTFSGWSEAPKTMPAEDVIIIGNFEVDGIDTIVSNKLVDIYTLQGIRVKRQIPVEDIENELPTGVYIVNGKKFIVK